MISRNEGRSGWGDLFVCVRCLGGWDGLAGWGYARPVVICLLNAYAGLAASASGFVLDNDVLIICGALDGGSGILLALIMSKAMNRSFGNVLFGAFGSVDATTSGAIVQANVREASVEDAAELLKIAGSVIFVPGYGMAVGQAQHAVRDLANLLMRTARASSTPSTP